MEYGKLAIAEEFARNILKVKNLNACTDYKYINKKEDKKNIIVEQIREDIVNDIYIMPSSGDMKVYIIDGAEYLNDAAQNALLKTLEEPPKYAVIILITSNNTNILPTVMSRVYKINFNKLNKEVLKKYILSKYNLQLDEDLINFIDGSMGFVDKIMNENLIEELNEIKRLYEDITKKDIIKCLKGYEKIDFNKRYTLDYLEYLFYINKEYLAIPMIEKAKVRLMQNGNYDIVVDNMILRCIDNV